MRFSFKFDKTTTSQRKKQYDAYSTFHSQQTSSITTSYLGSLYVGQCTADMLTYFHTMIEKLNLDVQLLLYLGMDDPNFNKCIQNKLEGELQFKGKMLISLGTSPLHIVSNALLEGLKSLLPDIGLNQFAIDLHSFFRYSSK